MMERERRARQHGAEADDRSFLGKYVGDICAPSFDSYNGKI